MDERTYRGGSHPLYCNCVECTRRRARRSRGGPRLFRRGGRPSGKARRGTWLGCLPVMLGLIAFTAAASLSFAYLVAS